MTAFFIHLHFIKIIEINEKWTFMKMLGPANEAHNLPFNSPRQLLELDICQSTF